MLSGCPSQCMVNCKESRFKLELSSASTPGFLSMCGDHDGFYARMGCHFKFIGEEVGVKVCGNMHLYQVRLDLSCQQIFMAKYQLQNRTTPLRTPFRGGSAAPIARPSSRSCGTPALTRSTGAATRPGSPSRIAWRPMLLLRSCWISGRQWNCMEGGELYLVLRNNLLLTYEIISPQRELCDNAGAFQGQLLYINRERCQLHFPISYRYFF